MTEGRSRMADLRAIGLVVGIMTGLGGGVWGAVSWAQGLKTRVDARADHQTLHKKISKVDVKADAAIDNTEQIQQTIGRDVKTIKCLLTAPSRKAKANCGLED